MSTPLFPGTPTPPSRAVWPDVLALDAVEIARTGSAGTAPPAAPPAAPAAAPRPWWRRARVLAPAAFLLGLGVGAVVSDGSAEATLATEPAGMVTTTPGARAAVGPTPLAVAPGTSAPAATPARRTASFAGEGTYLVPADVTPGTYRSEKPSSGSCYWARLNDPAGGLGAIIANHDNTLGPSVVTIAATDRAFETSGCATWIRVD